MRVSTRSAVAAVGVATLVLGLSACSNDSQPAASGAVTINGSEPENPLIPANTNETGGGNVVDNLFTGLVDYNPKTAAPELANAESIEHNSDLTVWTVKLKSGWTFHDGTPVTAQSYVDSWNWAAYGPNATLNSYFFGPDGIGVQGYDAVQGTDANKDKTITADEAPTQKMSGLAVVNDNEFTVTLDAPNGLFELIVGYSAFRPLPPAFFSNTACAPVYNPDTCTFGDNPIGNGPFKFVKWDKKQQIQITAYSDYKGQKPNFADVTFKIYQDLDAAYADLLAGNLDVLDSIPVSALAGDKYKSDLGDRYVNQPAGVIQTITMPLYTPPDSNKSYQNVDLRRALSMAINRDDIVKQIFNNTRQVATGFVSPVVNGYVANACGQNCTFNVDEAKKALASSGFTGSVTLAYNADGGHKEWTEAVCNQIKNNLGIGCTATPYVDFKTLRKAVNNKEMTGMFRTGWQMDYPSIENFLAPIYSSSGSANDGGYSNSTVDQLLKEGKGLTGDAANKKYQDAEKQISADMPAIPLWYGATTAGWSKNVSNVQFTPFSRVDLLTIKKG